jgi:hypothetical protein
MSPTNQMAGGELLRFGIYKFAGRTHIATRECIPDEGGIGMCAANVSFGYPPTGNSGNIWITYRPAHFDPTL